MAVVAGVSVGISRCSQSAQPSPAAKRLNPTSHGKYNPKRPAKVLAQVPKRVYLYEQRQTGPA